VPDCRLAGSPTSALALANRVLHWSFTLDRQLAATPDQVDVAEREGGTRLPSIARQQDWVRHHDRYGD
jgi:hypothetical protein